MQKNYERAALEEILRMTKVPLNGRETEASRMWRQDIASIAERGLFPPDLLTKSA